jgi:transcriptional accessory protein Tex/SPT6
MEKAIISYGKERDAETLSFSRIIIKHMDGNSNFPAPVPTVPDFTATVDSYDAALAAAGSNDRLAVAHKNTLKAEVAAGLRAWAMYVNTVSQGNADMIASSNFKRSKQREPVKLAAPVIKAVMQGLNPGSLLVIVQKPKGTLSLIYQIAKDPITDTTEWDSFGDTRSKFEFTNLEQGAKYWIRVIAIGSNNQSVQSEEVAQYVMQRTMAVSKAA